MLKLSEQNNAALERIYPWAIIFLSAFFLFYKYIMQVYPSVITSDLMRTFHVHGAGLGNLAATFFYSYMLTQLFVGVLLDKFSPRYLTSAAIACCAFGLLFFSATSNLLIAMLSRGLMGVGAAFATVSYMKLAANWFPPKRFAFVVGLLATAAMLGALFGEAPMAWLIEQVGWRASLLGWSAVGLIAAFIFYLVVRDAPETGPLGEQVSEAFKFRDLAQIFKNPQNWILTFYSGLSFAPVAVFGGLWGPPFIREAYDVSNTKAATIVSLAFAGLAIGAPLVGYLTERIRNPRHVMTCGAAITLVSVTIAIYVNPLPIWVLSCLFFIFGLSVSTFMMGFTIGKAINPLPLAATVIALINSGDAIFGAITEPMIGKFLDMGWQHKMVNGVPFFGVDNYHHALAVLPVYLFIALVLTFFIRTQKS